MLCWCEFNHKLCGYIGEMIDTEVVLAGELIMISGYFYTDIQRTMIRLYINTARHMALVRMGISTIPEEGAQDEEEEQQCHLGSRTQDQYHKIAI